MITLDNILAFIENHPKRVRAFKDDSLEQITNLIVHCYERESLYIVRDINDNIQGICLYELDRLYHNMLHIRAILTDNISEGVVSKMLQVLELKYPGVYLSAYRNGKYSIYNNTPRLVKLLNIISK